MKPTYSILTESEYFSQVSSSPGFNKGVFTEDLMEFATIDGGVVDYYSCEQAVNDGAGIFIGGYFVGVTDTTQRYVHQPSLRK
ncbi:hypothetical protein WG947_01925 [Pontibacter sp. H259]|uniref:hypothetical protein n=1 Tax=Pontibacter sp. H259 TaxID=3133421 RepID=UPI0030C23E22